MVVGMWVLILGLLMLFFGNILDRMDNPNTSVASRVDSDGVRQVVLKRNHRGHYVTSGEINGKRVKFMVDTGATAVAVPGALARSLGLTSGAPIVSHTANGTAYGYTTRLDSVSVGNIILRDVSADIAPTMNEHQVLPGMALIKHLEFTQRGDELTIKQYPD